MSLSPIYTGVWTDHSRGSVLGSTLTTTTTWAQVIISAATVMVQLTGVAIWAIVAFFLHQHQAKNESIDEFASQQAILLRNSGPVDTIVDSFNLAKAWHRHTSRSWPRILHLAAIALVIHVGFLAAGLCVTYIVFNPSSSLGLIKSQDCGFASGTATGNQSSQFGWDSGAKSYATQCYYLHGLLVNCNSTFAKPELSPTVISGTSCPMGSGACATGDDGGVFISKLLDSYSDLGINAPPRDRMVLQYNMTCAPLNHSVLESFNVGEEDPTTLINGTAYRTTQYVFGDSPNFQYAYNQLLSSNALASASYEVVYLNYQPDVNMVPGQPSSQGTLYSPLNKTNDDTIVVLISPVAMSYTAPNTDVVFGTQPQPYTNDSGTPLYRPAYNTSAIVCTQTYAACNPVNSKCTVRSGLWELLNSVFKNELPDNVNPWKDNMVPLGMNAAQNATMVRMLASMLASNLPVPINTSPSLYLSMTRIVQGKVSLSLDDNQWIEEVLFWWYTVMSGMQQGMQDFVNPRVPDAPPNTNYGTVYPSDPALAKLCNQQVRMLPVGYQNFSMFGILFILVISLLFILVAALLRTYYTKLPKRKPGEKNHYKALAWWSDGYFQLHRRALEGAGIDGWLERRDTEFEDIPVVKQARKRVRVPTGLTNDGEPVSDIEEQKGGGGDPVFKLPPDSTQSKSATLQPSESAWKPTSQQDFEDVITNGKGFWSIDSDDNTIS